MYWLGIDLGTSGIKAVIINETGEVVSMGYAEQNVITPKSGFAEQNPEVWWEACCSAVKMAVSKGNISGMEVRAIGFSGQMQGLVLLDSMGNVIRNCIIWMDQRAADEVKVIDEMSCKAGIDTLDITANDCLPTFWAPKLLWIKKYEPEIYEKINKILFPKDYLAFRMTGEMAAEVSDGSLSFLMDVPYRRWSTEMFELLGIPKSFVPNRLLESTDIVGELKASVAGEWGLKAGIPVIIGGGDQIANGIGTGIIREDVMGASIGTSAVVFGCSRKPFIDYNKRAIQSLCHGIPDLWCYLGLSLTAGASLKWMRDVIFREKKAEFEKQGKEIYDYITSIASKAAVGSGGVLFLPYFNGDSAPNNDPNARACFFGLSLNSDMPELCRSVMEGVAFSLRETIEVCRQTGKNIDTIRVSGGGSKSRLWRQIQADIFDASIATMSVEEGPACGAAIMAAVRSGYFSSVMEGCDAIVRVKDTIEPIRENVEIYDEYFHLYRSLYKDLRQSFKERAALIN